MGIKYLDGSMVPRTVRRWVDQRSEPRVDTALQPATILFRGRSYSAPVVNISPSGAMVIFRLIPFIGETIKIDLGDRGAVSARICWVKDGRVGVRFLESVLTETRGADFR
jgi:hypothetical protein